MSTPLAMRAKTPTSDDDDDLVVIDAPASLRATSQEQRSQIPPCNSQPHALSNARHAAPIQQDTRSTHGPKLNRKGKPLAVNRSNDDFKPVDFALPFCRFLSKNPTVFHAVDRIATQLRNNGYMKLSEREMWKLKAGGKYFVERNGSSLVAFAVGSAYKPGNGFAMIAGHVDALTVRLKPVSKLPTREGFIQLGVAPYSGGLNNTWWDRDLGIAGRVLVKEESGKTVTKLVNLKEPIARVPTLAPHFGAAAVGPFNPETQMVPIIGLDDADILNEHGDAKEAVHVGSVGTFASTQPQRLVSAIAGELGIQDYDSIVDWELELYDVQPATVGGLNKEFIYGGRIDDKLCSWAAIQALLGSSPADIDMQSSKEEGESGIVKLVALFDDEEIGSLLRQGARGNFLPSTVERIVESVKQADAAATRADTGVGANLLAVTYANSFLVSADVSHAVNPNFLNAYLPNHSPRLNVGVAVSADPNGHMTTDAASTALFRRCADACGASLQVFQIRNDSRSGGTVGPMLSSAMGCRAIDAGIVQLSMHSIRAATGALDPGLGVHMFKGFFDNYERVDADFR